MAANDGKQPSIPTWDGQPTGWRRYVKEVNWLVRGTKSSERTLLASRLLPKLTGPARLLAMSWPPQLFDNSNGVQVLLDMLGSSPLVRKPLGNASATLDRYFTFSRTASETIGAFLVREILAYEEFVEALRRLREEETGKSQVRDYGLPPTTSTTHEEAWPGWIRDATGYWTRTDEETIPTDDGDDVPAERPQPPEAAEYVPLRAHSSRTPSVASHATQEKDSFELGEGELWVLNILRGYRLLKAASLHPDERRDVLAATQNKLDYAAVSSALQTLWEDLHKTHHGHNTAYAVQQEVLDHDDSTTGWGDSSWAYYTSDYSGSGYPSWDDSSWAYYATDDWQTSSWDNTYWSQSQDEDLPHDLSAEERTARTNKQNKTRVEVEVAQWIW